MFVKALRSKMKCIVLGNNFNVSYHMINSNVKSQSYNSKYAVSAITSSYICQRSWVKEDEM